MVSLGCHRNMCVEVVMLSFALSFITVLLSHHALRGCADAGNGLRNVLESQSSSELPRVGKVPNSSVVIMKWIEGFRLNFVLYALLHCLEVCNFKYCATLWSRAYDHCPSPYKWRVRKATDIRAARGYIVRGGSVSLRLCYHWRTRQRTTADTCVT